MKQLALDIGIATGPTLRRLFAGPNEAALRHLQVWVGERAAAPRCTRRCPPTCGAKAAAARAHLLEVGAWRTARAGRQRGLAARRPAGAARVRRALGRRAARRRASLHRRAAARGLQLVRQRPDPAARRGRRRCPAAGRPAAARRPAHPPGLGPCVPPAGAERNRTPRGAAPGRRRARRDAVRRRARLHAAPIQPRPRQPDGAARRSSTAMRCRPSTRSPSR